MTNEQICKINELLANMFAGKQLQRLSFNQLHNDSEWVDWKELSISEHMNIDHYRIKPDQKPLTREEITAQWVRDNDVKVGDKVRLKHDKPFMLKGEIWSISEIRTYWITCESFAKKEDFNVEDLEKISIRIEKFTFEDREMFRDKWVRPKGSTNEEYKLGVIANWGVAESIGDQSPSFTYENALKEIEFIDGKPFGKEVWE